MKEILFGFMNLGVIFGITLCLIVEGVIAGLVYGIDFIINKRKEK